MRDRSLSRGEASNRTVLVLRALGLGDALTGVPALRGIRRAYPRHRLLLACGPEIGDWLVSLGVVDGVVATDGLADLTGAPSPDVAIDLHGRGPRSHEVLRMTRPHRLFGFACADADFDNGPQWDDDAHEVDRWCTLARSLGGPCDRDDLRLETPTIGSRPGPIVVHPGAASASRRWPVARWRRLLRELAGCGPVVVTGGASDVHLAAEVCRGSAATSRAGGTSLPQIARLVAGSRLVVSGDTGIAHLATAFGTPSVTLFGPVSPSLWGPAIDAAIHECIWHGAGRAVGGDPHGSRLDPCLDAVSVPEVAAAVQGVLRRTARWFDPPSAG